MQEDCIMVALGIGRDAELRIIEQRETMSIWRLL